LLVYFSFSIVWLGDVKIKMELRVGFSFSPALKDMFNWT
jgi:hypothetical protein